MAFCPNCGAPLAAGARFCPSCGAAVGGAQPATRTSSNAIASLVLGIAGLIVLPLIPSIFAITFGHAARREIAQRPGTGGEGMATAGIVMGWIGVAVGILVLLVFVYILALASSLS
jgi:uncharacterized protein DUF4190/zinc ribbon protein